MNFSHRTTLHWYFIHCPSFEKSDSVKDNNFLFIHMIFKPSTSPVIGSIVNSVLILIITYVILLPFTSCSRSFVDEGVTHFTRNDFPIKTKLTSEEILFKESLLPLEYTILRDTLLLVTNWDASSNFLDLYNMNTREKIVSLTYFGRGPNELLSCKVIHRDPNEDFFYAFDMVAKTVTKYNIDSVLTMGKHYNPNYIKLPHFTKDLAFESDSILAVYNDSYTFGLYNKTPSPFVKLKLHNGQLQNYEEPSIKYFSTNISGGYLLTNREKIVVAYHYTDRIDFFNGEELCKSMIGPDKIIPELQFDTNNSNELAFKKGMYYRSYYPVAHTDNYIYLSYIGLNQPDALSIEKPIEVFKIDWEGNLIALFELDKFIYNISISKDERYIYGTAAEKFGDYPQLVRYKIR